MPVGKQNWWAWVFHHDRECCSSIRPSRGKDVVEAFLGEQRPDFWVSDRLAAQMGWAQKDNQVCLAHLIRDANYPPPCASYSSALAPSPAGVPASPTPRCALTPKNSTLSWTRSCA